jgi:hypothetical protein
MKLVDSLRARLGLEDERQAYTRSQLDRRVIVEHYRNVFRSAEGRAVFVHMMRELGLFEIATTPEEIELKNYATRLVMRLGLTSTEDLCNAILDSKYTEEKE